MKSRLLSRLEADIRSASSASAADCLRCQRAVCLARHGAVDAAIDELAAIRQRHGSHAGPLAFAWLNLAEGLVDRLAHPGAASHPQARLKIARAQALGCAARASEVRALAAAWLAHLDGLQGDLEGLTRQAVESLAHAAPHHHAARGRVSLVIARAYDAAGQCADARPWYVQAHWHATAEGDDAALGAVLWQLAVGRLAAWRQTETGGSAPDPQGSSADPARHVRTQVDSTALFDRLAGVTERQALHPVLRAQCCVMAGAAAEALALYDDHLTSALANGFEAAEGMLRADQAWCRISMGQREAAQADAAAAETELERPAASNGDLACGHRRLVEVYRALDMADAALRQEVLAAERLAAHLADQRSAALFLDRALATLTPPKLHAAADTAEPADPAHTAGPPDIATDNGTVDVNVGAAAADAAARPGARTAQNKVMLSLRR